MKIFLIVWVLMMQPFLQAENLNMQILYQDHSHESEVISNGLALFNAPFFGHQAYVDLVICLKDENQDVVAGVIAWMRPGIHLLCIDTVWVAEHLRHRGYGTQLVLAAEQEGIKHGCDHSQLESLPYQAKSFYEKLGYVQIGCVEKLYGEHDAFYMRKKLIKP